MSYLVERMSFGRRLELMKSVRDAAAKLEFYEASLSDADKMTASILSAEVDKIYVAWGLREVDGLLIDGERATPESLSRSGPEDLFREALTAVKEQCGLSEAEKKT